jgi:peptidase E
MKQIVAFGGGGFSMEPSPWIDDFVLSCSRRPRPRVCFLPTASGDAATYIARFYRAFAPRECVPTDLTLLGNAQLSRQPASDAELAAFVAEQDIVYVGGGNTANMLALWRVHGLDRALRAAWEAGTVMAGLSAGMICWFAASVTDSYGPLAPMHDGLALLPYSACPHYDSERDRRPRYQALVGEGLPAGYAADDGAALHFVGDQLEEVVTSRPAAAAYWVERQGDSVVEKKLPARHLA